MCTTIAGRSVHVVKGLSAARRSSAEKTVHIAENLNGLGGNVLKI